MSNKPLIEPNDRFVREKECRFITGVSRQKRWELEAKGLFPKSVRLGARTVAWRLSDLMAWVNNVAERGCL